MKKKLFMIGMSSIFFSCSDLSNTPQIIEYYSSGEKKIEKIDTFSGSKYCLRQYFKMGNLEKECCYLGETLDGPYVHYFENGNVRYKASFKEGQVDGIARIFYENGMLKEEAEFTYGRKDGELRFYNEQGQLRAVNFFIDDFLHYKKVYNADGSGSFEESFIPSISIDKDTIPFEDTLNVMIQLPLPREKFDLENIYVNFDFANHYNPNELLYPSIKGSMKKGFLEKSFFIQEPGKQTIYGFLSREVGGQEEIFQSFNKEFYVVP